MERQNIGENTPPAFFSDEDYAKAIKASLDAPGPMRPSLLTLHTKEGEFYVEPYAFNQEDIIKSAPAGSIKASQLVSSTGKPLQDPPSVKFIPCSKIIHVSFTVNDRIKGEPVYCYHKDTAQKFLDETFEKAAEDAKTVVKNLIMDMAVDIPAHEIYRDVQSYLDRNFGKDRFTITVLPPGMQIQVSDNKENLIKDFKALKAGIKQEFSTDYSKELYAANQLIKESIEKICKTKGQKGQDREAVITEMNTLLHMIDLPHFFDISDKFAALDFPGERSMVKEMSPFKIKRALKRINEELPKLVQEKIDWIKLSKEAGIQR